MDKRYTHVCGEERGVILAKHRRGASLGASGHQLRRTCVVVDRTRPERSAPVRLAFLAEIDAMFTDRPLPDAMMKPCEDCGTEVHVAL